MPNFWWTGAPRILKIQWFPLSILIFGQISCFLGPTIFKIPLPNWYYPQLPYLKNKQIFVSCFCLFGLGTLSCWIYRVFFPFFCARVGIEYKNLWQRGHSMTTWTQFCPFWSPPTSMWTFLTLNVDKNRDLLTTYHPYCPRSHCMPHWKKHFRLHFPKSQK